MDNEKTVIYSVSDKRIIVPGIVNGKKYHFLVDTGASVPLISERVRGIVVGKPYSGGIVGAGGQIKARHCNTFVNVGGKPMTQFLIADIDNIIASIRHETGVEIAGIISLPQMRFYGVEIDTDDNFIRI